jgi:hypothetical protein
MGSARKEEKKYFIRLPVRQEETHCLRPFLHDSGSSLFPLSLFFKFGRFVHKIFKSGFT